MFVSRGARSFAAGILIVIVSLYYKALFHSVVPIGFLFGAGALGVPVISYAAGRYADRFGRKRLLLLTISLLPIAVAMLLVTTNYYLLMLSATIGGFGVAGAIVGGGVGASAAPMQIALLAEKTNLNNRTMIFSLFQIMSSITASAGAASASLANFHSLFDVALVLSTASFFIALPISESFRPQSSKQEVHSGRPERRERTRAERENMKTINKFVMTGVVNGASQGFILPFLPIILQSNMDMSTGTIGYLFAAGGLISAFLMFATPYLTKKLGFVRFIISTRSVSSVFLIYFPFASSAITASIAYVVFSASRTISLPAQSSLMMSLVDEKTRAYATGTNQSARLLPSAAASSSSGGLLEFFSYVVPFEIAFALNVVNIYLYHKFFGKMPTANSTASVIPETETERL